MLYFGGIFLSLRLQNETRPSSLGSLALVALFPNMFMFAAKITNYPFDNLKSDFRSICKIAISSREIFLSVKSNSHFHKILNAYKKNPGAELL